MRLFEAIRAEPRGDVAFFRWLLEVYDLRPDAEGREALCTKLKSTLVSRDLDRTIPGKMKGYTHLSLCFLVWCKHQEMPGHTPEAYARSMGLWVGATSLSQILLSLDTLSFRWRDLEESPDLQIYIQHLFRRGAWICTRLHPERILDVPSLRYEHEGLFRVHPSVFVQLGSRFRHFARYPARKRRGGDSPALVWLWGKEKNLRVRAFRSEILKLVWERMLLPGDREIAPGNPLASLQKRLPPFLLDITRKRIMHGKLKGDDLDVWCLHQVQMTFAPLGLDFKKIASCTREWKHKGRIHRIPIPIIVRRNHYQLVYLGKDIGPPTSFPRAFEGWLRTLEEMCKSTCYGVNLQGLIDEILRPPPEEEGVEVPL